MIALIETNNMAILALLFPEVISQFNIIMIHHSMIHDTSKVFWIPETQ